MLDPDSSNNFLMTLHQLRWELLLQSYSSVKEGTTWYGSNLFGKGGEIVQRVLGAMCCAIFNFLTVSCSNYSPSCRLTLSDLRACNEIVFESSKNMKTWTGFIQWHEGEHKFRGDRYEYNHSKHMNSMFLWNSESAS